MTATSTTDFKYRMPAEWEPQQMIWFSWPKAKHLWPRRMGNVHNELLRVFSILSRSMHVGINGIRQDDEAFQHKLANFPELDQDRLIFSGVPNNDAWCRDHGPTFVLSHENNQLAGIDWNFNAWGEKYEPWAEDNKVARRLLEDREILRIDCPFIGEGGGLEVDGKGTVMLTDSVWLNPNRNPDIKKKEVELWLFEHLGCRQAHWFTDGLAQDDTDGHVDMFARFVTESAMVVCHEKNTSHPQYRALQQIREQLSGFKTLTRGHYDVIDLPMPEPVFDDEGNVCPATYGNFLIINDFVLVPQYEQERPDAHALGVLNECFPKHELVGVNCTDFITEGGAIHCLSQQQPKHAKS